MTSTNQHLSEAAPIQNRISRYDRYFDQRTLSETLRKTNKPVKKRFTRESALVVIRIIDYKGRHSDTKVEIRSAALSKILMEINEDVDGLELTRNPPVADPKVFFHSYSGLKERLAEEQLKGSPDDALIADIKVALQYIEEDHAANIADFTKLIAHQEITYELLWALLSPNTLLYHYHPLTEQVQVLLAREVTYCQREDETYYASIMCNVIINDGESFGLSRVELEVDEFSGARRIQDLIVYPLKYHENQDTMRDHAINRGKRFVLMGRNSYNEISGHAMREKSNEYDGSRSRLKFHTYGRVMIDPIAFNLFEPDCTFNLKIHIRLERDRLTDEQYMICSPILLGFCFGVKMWGGFAMDRLQDIPWSDEAFRLLVLGSKQKTLIHSLVKQHIARSTLFDDVIQGKGLGLIGLLSGSPGCGKTLTAEAVAEIIRRPLYMVTAGELGTDPSTLDQCLARIFELAQMWNAVVLLDEAEVFLQQRTVANVKRNALVSIFLRQLEYYQGILLMTTNMIDQCDVAFESRIHFSIHYPDLDFEARKKIWRIFLEKATQGASAIGEGDLDRLATNLMNGRQIKNAVSSAQCIALENNAQLSVEHVETVLDIMSDWKRARPPLLESMI